MKYISKLGIAAFNLIIGFISFWWFIISYAAALNIDHEAENEIFIPFGVVALIILLIAVIGSNWAIYKHKSGTARGLVIGQVVPFVLGFAISLLLETIGN